MLKSRNSLAKSGILSSLLGDLTRVEKGYLRRALVACYSRSLGWEQWLNRREKTMVEGCGTLQSCRYSRLLLCRSTTNWTATTRLCFRLNPYRGFAEKGSPIAQIQLGAEAKTAYPGSCNGPGQRLKTWTGYVWSPSKKLKFALKDRRSKRQCSSNDGL